MEDVIQTLSDLRLAYIGRSTNEVTGKPSDGRYRRRPKPHTCDDNNNHLDSSSTLTIDEVGLRTALDRLLAGNVLTTYHQNMLETKYLRLVSRR